jgi:hypothetical protein
VIIFNHPAFLGKFARFLPVFQRAAVVAETIKKGGSAQKRRFIKPNKTEPPKKCK